MTGEEAATAIRSRVARAVVWRSGSQIVAQLAMWASTFWVLRLLQPADYGLYAMTAGLMVLLSMLNGSGFVGQLIRANTVTPREVRQMFGLLIALNGGIALIQLAAAPLAGAYFRHPLVTTMLQVQTLVYFANPLIVLPGALLARQMDFRKQAKVNIVAALTGAGTALAGALAGLGVWTLVLAPLVHAWTRAIGMTLAARMLVRPSFSFVSAGPLLRFGGTMLACDLLWLVQSQSDVLIGGRVLSPHRLGIYTTSLFLAQIVASKFIPPLNEVAYTAYAKLSRDDGSAARAFEVSLRIVFLLALPLHLGLAVAARPIVEVMLGPKWEEAIPVVRVLALAMPFLTLQVLFSPAAVALGHERVRLIAAAAGAVIMPLPFLIAVRWGPIGLAWAWLGGMPVLALITARAAMPAIGLDAAAVWRAVRPALLCGAMMALAVGAADMAVASPSPAARLGLLVSVGAAVYAASAMLFAREPMREVLSLIASRSARPSSDATTAAA